MVALEYGKVHEILAFQNMVVCDGRSRIWRPISRQCLSSSGKVRAVTVHDEDGRVIFRQPRQRRLHAALDVLEAWVISDPALLICLEVAG